GAGGACAGLDVHRNLPGSAIDTVLRLLPVSRRLSLLCGQGFFLRLPDRSADSHVHASSMPVGVICEKIVPSNSTIEPHYFADHGSPKKCQLPRQLRASPPAFAASRAIVQSIG